MAWIQEQTLHLLLRSCRYTVPDDLRFSGIVVSEGGGPIRIRFVRDRDITLDIPLSAETLADLIQATGHMFPVAPDEIPEAIENYRQQGGPVIDE